MSRNRISIVNCHGRNVDLDVHSSLSTATTVEPRLRFDFTISVCGQVMVDCRSLVAHERGYQWFAQTMSSHGIAMPSAFFNAIGITPIADGSTVWPTYKVTDLEKYFLLSGFTQAPYVFGGKITTCWQFLGRDVNLGYYRCLHTESTRVYLPLKLTDFDEKTDSFIEVSEEQLMAIMQKAYAELSQRLGFKPLAATYAQLAQMVGFHPAYEI